MKKLIKKILFPYYIIGFLIFNLGFGLLIFVFTNHLEETIIAYISYALSFYALVIFCFWFYKISKFSNEFIKKSRIYNLYQKKSLTVIKTTILISFSFNLIYGLFKLIIGIYYMSWWFITFAIYYLLLCIMKLSLAKNINNHQKAYPKLMHTGTLSLFFNLILIVIIILIIKHNQIINYNGYLIYIMAMYDFYLIISAIINVIKHRQNNNPIIIASKCLNLTVAMISMLSLEVAMIYQFGNNDYNFKLTMITYSGFAICLINSLMSIYMILKAKKHCQKSKIVI